jgi:hypothetical protein
MTIVKIINIFFFALGVASCLYLIISIILRNIKKDFEDMKSDLLKELKGAPQGSSRRRTPHAAAR